MAKKEIPKYVQKLLERRCLLAQQLSEVGCQLDTYCKKLGLELGDDENALMSHVMIYCEPSTAYRCTKQAIERALNPEGGEENGS